MAQQKIQLRKLRDFGENFSDTFQFIRQEFKPLMTSFILVAGVFMLINAIVAGMFQGEAWGSLISAITKGVYEQDNNMKSFFTPTYFLLIALTVLTLASMRTVVSVYLHHYDQYGTSPTIQEVWSGFIKKLVPIFIFSIIQSVLIIIGFLFCFVPGIYFFTVLMPYSFIMISENGSVGYTFSRCFDLIKENFWISLGIYVVSYLIFSVSSSIVGFVVSLIVGGASYLTTKEINTTLPVVAAVLNLVQYLFYIIFFISAGLHYYNLVEIKDGTGLARRLESLGSDIHPNTNMEEQY